MGSTVWVPAASSMLIVDGLMTVVQNEHISDHVIVSFKLHSHTTHRVRVIFDYKSRISWWIFIIFKPLETGTNTPQSYVIYLLDGLMTS